jgi:arsenate reductase
LDREKLQKGATAFCCRYLHGQFTAKLMGSTMGNIAAAYYGFPEIKFYSGGTAPTAFNSRTIKALREVGVLVDDTGKKAPKGEPATDNPIYAVRWGKDGSNLETTEFSKKYDDEVNPKGGFVALMVCGEADAGCPFVKGASARISMPYLDPKVFDGGAYEANKYAERRDDMGRLMLGVMMQSRLRLHLRSTDTK